MKAYALNVRRPDPPIANDAMSERSEAELSRAIRLPHATAMVVGTIIGTAH